MNTTVTPGGLVGRLYKDVRGRGLLLAGFFFDRLEPLETIRKKKLSYLNFEDVKIVGLNEEDES